MKNKIFIKDWLSLKPYENQVATDSYYLNISNKVYQCFYEKQALPVLMYLHNDEVKMLSCFLTSYFEDVISEANIWNTFINIHFKMCGKILPFYSTDEYYQGEINIQDIGFLIWYFMNTVQNEKFISPFNDFITSLASQVMDIFDREYEYAPANENLKQYYSIAENENDYYKVRHLMQNIFFKNYLFFSDTKMRLNDMFEEVLEQGRDENTMQYFNEVHDFLLHKAHTRLLSLKANVWGAELLGKKHPLHNDLLEMSPRISGYFFYKGQDNENIFIEHVASGKKFNLTKKSFDYADELRESDLLYLGIVKWQKEWWFSGVYFKNDFDADIVLDEKNSVESRAQVNFLDHKNAKTQEVLQMQQDAFLQYNNGSPIAFLPASEINEFLQKWLDFYNQSLNLSKKDREAARERAKKEGFLRNNLISEINISEDVESALVFFNPNSGVEIALEINNAFPLPHNPFFDETRHEEDVMHIFISDEISTELANYCIEQGKDKLPFFKEGMGAHYLTDIDFLLRFWKSDAYHTKPKITFTGQNTKAL